MKRWHKLLIGLLALVAVAALTYYALKWAKNKIPADKRVTEVGNSTLRANTGLNALSLVTLGAWTKWQVTLLLYIFTLLVAATVIIAIVNVIKSPRAAVLVGNHY